MRAWPDTRENVTASWHLAKHVPHRKPQRRKRSQASPMQRLGVVGSVAFGPSLETMTCAGNESMTLERDSPRSSQRHSAWGEEMKKDTARVLATPHWPTTERMADVRLKRGGLSVG